MGSAWSSVRLNNWAVHEAHGRPCVPVQAEPAMEGALAGHVKSVRVEAFKCHDHFEVELGCVTPIIQTLQLVKAYM